jgi:hypothetical protein
MLLPFSLRITSLPSVTRLMSRVSALGPAPQPVSVSARADAINAIDDFLNFDWRMGEIISCQITLI